MLHSYHTTIRRFSPGLLGRLAFRVLDHQSGWGRQDDSVPSAKDESRYRRCSAAPSPIAPFCPTSAAAPRATPPSRTAFTTSRIAAATASGGST